MVHNRTEYLTDYISPYEAHRQILLATCRNLADFWTKGADSWLYMLNRAGHGCVQIIVDLIEEEAGYGAPSILLRF
jgi:hypothetical protein